ncbi:16S rRNA (adenine(1518)-N(6)/adenine(1519)-N(6))-dimethyltransferase RsmA [Candidatus Mycoplasma mahonii]|uniref:16S rRNA (adenine(1518)-N(6)/adenine(1519)-N(6))- dimethyltransferase RsmA n=1 Tax=Candidatus Mycoplasma mahonii TaxID=3004105 RepID=UPI0026EE960D|nr:16S rRNA (adenine(1518)-N(6)/adenine(1519)-N(6))-dimethyltransferase RsmA [Candidatus Mycoplasma mahonii]WKX02428.1 16S rRNA (adenine(1518)-N(6)/adenine(1519)-N(6))-dimethyltransferase RsmA [Candidatus Mycoplasma mahonii]
MNNLSAIKNLYKKYDVSASKRFGQNFLIDQNVLDEILKLSKIKNKDVVEIGPGLGSLTTMLLQDANTVTCYEIDRDMIRVLQGEIRKSNFNLIEGDFLKDNLNWSGQKTLVANIPYYITSHILFKVFDNAHKFNKCIIMMQDEVGSRLVAKVGSKQYGKLTLTANLYVKNIKRELIVNPKSFVPFPKINSVVMSFETRDDIIENHKEIALFFRLMFSQRRKTLLNNMKILSDDTELLKSIILESNIKINARPQELDGSTFKILFKNIKNKNIKIILK